MRYKYTIHVILTHHIFHVHLKIINIVSVIELWVELLAGSITFSFFFYSWSLNFISGASRPLPVKSQVGIIPNVWSYPNKAIYLAKFPLNYPQLVCCRKSQKWSFQSTDRFLIYQVKLTLLAGLWMLRLSLLNVL